MIIQELRIGNWVNITGQPVLIKEIEYSPLVADNCRANNTPIDKIEPIELTEQIVEKVTFDKFVKGYETRVNLDFSISIYLWQSGVSNHVKSISTLHDWQNTFYYLVGIELKIVL